MKCFDKVSSCEPYDMNLAQTENQFKPSSAIPHSCFGSANVRLSIGNCIFSIFFSIFFPGSFAPPEVAACLKVRDTAMKFQTVHVFWSAVINFCFGASSLCACTARSCMAKTVSFNGPHIFA